MESCSRSASSNRRSSPVQPHLTLPATRCASHLLALVALGGDVLPLLHDRLKQLLQSSTIVMSLKQQGPFIMGCSTESVLGASAG